MSLITSQYIYQRVKEGGVYVSAFKLFVSGKLRIRFSNEGCQYFKKWVINVVQVHFTSVKNMKFMF